MTQKLKKKQLYKLVNQMQKQMLYACTYCKTQFNKKKMLVLSRYSNIDVLS